MEHILGVAPPSHNVAARADRGGPGKGSAGIIEAAELAPAHQIGMSYAVERVPPDDFTAGIDVGRVREASATWVVDCGDLAIAQHKPMRHIVGPRVRSHNVAAVESDQHGRSAGGEDIVDGAEQAKSAELAPAHQKVMVDVGAILP